MYSKCNGMQTRKSRQLDNKQQAGALIYGFVCPCYMWRVGHHHTSNISSNRMDWGFLGKGWLRD